MTDHMTPERYARILAARHSDIGFIRAQVLREFGHSPSRDKIAGYRAEHERDAAARYQRQFGKYANVGVNGNECRKKAAA